MNAWLVRAFTLLGFAAPLGVIILLHEDLSLQAAFVALCCGIGLAAGVESCCKAQAPETLLPQANFNACRFKEDLGLDYDERTLLNDHVTEYKYLALLLFLIRFAVNIKALLRNTLAVCTEELPVTVGSVARVLEAGIFLEHFCKLPCELLSCLRGASPCNSISTVKTLAGFSSMRFLRFLNKRHILGALRKIAADPNIFKGCYLVIIGLLYSLVLAGFGLAVLLSKLRGLDVQAMEAAGVEGLFQEAFQALQLGFGAFMGTKLMQLVGFTNQVASAMAIQEEELQRMLSFLLGDRDGLKAKHFMDQVMLNFMKLPRWRSRLVAMITFDAGGLQRLVRARPQS
ncbi:unnamed protein product [Effrenium voratum]|uniref:Uncharacterized protein n=1 Tax=Effrenium voratum TaxID=2562239 RepID=A0AA36J589_9DINO|nr:unnamed protein product [Effrenium voratum]CAJ1427775.1 unnamed protein product [Effrenium voratum]